MITEDLLKISSNQDFSGTDSSICSHVGEDTLSECHTSACESDDNISSYRVSPGGQKYYVPVCVDEIWIPYINQCFDSLDKAIIFYKEYGRFAGFDIRRASEKKSDDGTILIKHLVCSKEGFIDNKGDSSCLAVAYKRKRTMSSRCGCKARLVLKYVAGGKYVVLVFIEEHNHTFASDVGRQFLRVSREMSSTSRNFVFDAGKVNIGPSRAHSLMKEMVGDYANVGSTSRDYRNFNRDVKVHIGKRDSEMILRTFRDKKEVCESFFYASDVDSDGDLNRLFWADPIARRNYELYGDAVSFDATFDTNKYIMIFVPFTGVDKHEKCVTFAAALISKEDIPSFKWVFDMFLKAMGRNPVCLVTDQCPAMRQAIPASFCATEQYPATKHRLCMWHIMQKFPMKLGNHLCKETDFMEKLKKYIWSSYLEPDEFEEGWKTVLKEFDLEGNKWLSDMYEMRMSWIPAYFHDEPMFGLMRTTSRSESENFFFSQFQKNGDTLCEFYMRFQSAMDKQRHENARLSYEDNGDIVGTLSTLYIERDCAKIYTRAVFYKIQQEIIASCFDMRIQSVTNEVDGINCYEMKDVKLPDKIFKVKVSNCHVDCSCKKFIMCGILCRHAFYGLTQFGMTKLPRNLALNRWMKCAESAVCLSKLAGVFEDLSKMNEVSVELTNVWFDFNQCVNKAGVDIAKLGYIHDMIKDMSRKLDDGSSSFTKKDFICSLVGEQPSGEITVGVPKECKNKGSRLKRYIGAREEAIKSKEKRVRRCKCCGSTLHDARTCKNKKSIVELVDEVESEI